MWPTMSTSRSSSSTTPIPSSTATSEAGMAGASRLRPSTTASDATPTASVSASVSPSPLSTPQACSKKSPSALSMPNSFGTWPMMIVSASPTMKPLITGSEMKLARKPRRRIPASSAAIPVVSASAAVNAAKRLSPTGMTSATVAAESAAVALIGPHTRCRERAERGVQDQRPRRRVQADHRRDAGDARVRQRLRDQDGPDRQARDQVAAQPAPVIAPQRREEHRGSAAPRGRSEGHGRAVSARHG